MAVPDEAPIHRLVAVNQSGDVSGAELVLLDHVRLAVEAGLEVVVACPEGPLVERLPAGARHLALPAFGLGAAGRTQRLVAVVRLIRNTVTSARRLAPEVRRPGTRTVVNSLLALPAVRLARPRPRATWLVHDVVVTRPQRAFVAAGWGSLAAAVAVSEATAAPLRRPNRTILVRPNGVPWPVEPIGDARHDPAVVGTAALMVGWKGHLVLLEAITRLPDVRCELAGGTIATDAEYARAVERRAAASDLTGRVRLLGHVDTAVVMRGWDVAVLASLRPEAGPLAVLEAMSVGLPVVATDHGGSAEYLASGRGILVEPGDPDALASAIRQALDPEARGEIARRGRAYVGEHHDRATTLPAQHDALLHPR